MINRIISAVNKKPSSEYGNIFKNFSFLTAIQLANYVIPLITLPYLVNVLGASSFGNLMFAQAFVSYFITVVEYGFNFSATKEISINRDNKKVVSEIFYSVMTLRCILFFISLALLIVIVFSIDKFTVLSTLFLLTFSMVIGNTLFPTWFFQGLEQMKYVTMVNVSSKAAAAFFIFLFIKTPGDLLKVPLINSVCTIVPSILALCYARKVFPLEFVRPSFSMLYRYLKSGWFVFLSSVSSSLYTVSNTFVLGLLFNATYAGYYAFAEKIIRAGTSLFASLNGALFPYMSKKMKESQVSGVRIFKYILLILVLITSFASLAVFLASDLVITYINPAFYPSAQILKILSPLLIIVGVSNLTGFQVLYTNNLEREFLLSVFIAGLLNLLFCFLLSSTLMYKAAAVSLLISEGFICLSFLFISRKILLQRL